MFPKSCAWASSFISTHILRRIRHDANLHLLTYCHLRSQTEKQFSENLCKQTCYHNRIKPLEKTELSVMKCIIHQSQSVDMSRLLNWVTDQSYAIGRGMAQWWEYSPSTNVARVRFPVPVSYVGWVCCWFSFLLRGFFSGYSAFPPFIKTKISKFQCDLHVKCLHMSPWLGRLGDYSLHYDVKIWFTDFFFLLFALFVIVRSERDISAAILVVKFTCLEGLEEVTLISSKYLGTLLPIILSGDKLQFLMPGPDKNESRQSTVPKKMATGTLTHSS